MFVDELVFCCLVFCSCCCFVFVCCCFASKMILFVWQLCPVHAICHETTLAHAFPVHAFPRVGLVLYTDQWIIGLTASVIDRQENWMIGWFSIAGLADSINCLTDCTQPFLAVEHRAERRQQREKELQTLALRAFGSPGNLCRSTLPPVWCHQALTSPREPKTSYTCFFFFFLWQSIVKVWYHFTSDSNSLFICLKIKPYHHIIVRSLWSELRHWDVLILCLCVTHQST